MPNLKIDPADWRPFDEVYSAFVEANPMLGLNASEFASTRLRQQYGKQLLAAGAARRLPNRRWLANPWCFARVLFDAMTSRRNDILKDARAHVEDEPATAVPTGDAP